MQKYKKFKNVGGVRLSEEGYPIYKNFLEMLKRKNITFSSLIRVISKKATGEKLSNTDLGILKDMNLEV